MILTQQREISVNLNTGKQKLAKLKHRQEKVEKNDRVSVQKLNV